MGLNFDLTPILGKLPTDDQLARDHSLLPGDAVEGAVERWRPRCCTRALHLCGSAARRGAARMA